MSEKDLSQNNGAGNLNLNADPRRIKFPDYADAKGVAFSTGEGGRGWAVKDIKGNSYQFEIPDVEKQNLIFRIEDADGAIGTGFGYQIYFYDAQGNQLIEANSIYTFADFQDAVTDALDTATITYNITTGTGYFTIEILDIACYPYLFKDAVGINAYVQQEAYDDWIAGKQILIGACPVLDRTYLFSTTIDRTPEAIEVGDGLFISDSGVVLDVTIPTRLFGKSTFLVRIVGDGVDTDYDGIWMADATASSSGIKLLGATYTGVGSAKTVYFGENGFGQVGVVRREGGADVYTRLLASTEFNWQAAHQIDCDGEQQTMDRDALYPTDDFNSPSALYFDPRNFTTDAGLSLNGGIYEYGNIADESILWQKNQSKITNVETVVGGEVLAGTWRYGITFTNEQNVETNISPLTQLIPMFESDAVYGETEGQASDQRTGKKNSITVSDIPQGVYKYIVLYGAHYASGVSVNFYRIKQELLRGDTTVTIDHTGTETAIEQVDGSIVTLESILYKTAKNVRIIDDKLVYSNLTQKVDYDFSDFCKTFQHKVLRNETYTIYDYQRLEGYMLNETYRFGAYIRLKDGRFVPNVFWVDDILIDSALDGITPINNALHTDDPYRRLESLTDHSLSDSNTTDIAANNIFIPYVQFTIPDMSFKVDGIPAKDLISEIWITRAECVPSIKGMGLFIPIIAVIDDGLPGTTTPVGQYENLYMPGSGLPSSGTTGDYMMWQILGEYGGYTFNATLPEEYTCTPYTTDGWGCFYSPDGLFNNVYTNVFTTDKYINLGVQSNFNNQSQAFAFILGDGGVDYSTQTEESITEKTTCSTGNLQSSIYLPGTSTIYYNALNPMSNGSLYYYNYRCNILKIDNQPSLTGSNGHFLCQVKSVLDDQYGDLEYTKYIHTNCYSDSLSDSVTIDVYGGDTYTQIYSLQYRSTDLDESEDGSGAVVQFICQAKVDSFMRQKAFDAQKYMGNFSGTDVANSQQIEEFAYNKAYSTNGNNAVNYLNAYDPNIPNNEDLPTAIIWGSSGLAGSYYDSKRVFPPLNIKIEDMKDGEITHHENVNGELVTIQPQAYKRQFFTQTGRLKSSEDLTINLVSGEALSVNGDKQTKYGSQHKWSHIKGVTQGGKDVVYSIDANMGVITRHGMDGTIPISERCNISEWLKENIEFVRGHDKPAYIAGINGIWDEQNKWVIWSLKGYSITATEWASDNSYPTGSYALYNGNYYQWNHDTYNGLRPDMQPVNSQDTWDLVEPDVYYSIVFDENSNGFKCFLPPQPKIFFNLLNNYYSPSYFTDTNKMYKHNDGDYLSWYDGNLEEDGYIQFVDNQMPSELKKYTNIQVESLEKPYLCDFENETQFSQLTENDFEGVKQIWRSPIKNEITGSGTNDDATSQMIDTYIKIKFYFEKKVKQRLLNILTKKTFLNRSPKSL